MEQVERGSTVWGRIAAIAFGIFSTVEMMLDWPVIDRDQRCVLRRHPTFRVRAIQRPVHDVTALVHNLPIGQYKYRDSCIGGGFPHGGWILLSPDFTPFACLSATESLKAGQ